MPNTTAVRTAQVGAAPFFAGKNKIINGDFNIWQRGTSFTPASSINTYTADRFLVSRDGTGATVTVSRQSFTSGTAPVSGYENAFFFRYAQTVAGTGGTYLTVCSQNIEDVRTFAGQTITYSFWAKADTTRTLTVGYAQQFGSGGSTTVYGGIGSTITLTTSWARYSVTGTIPSISGKTVGTSSYLEIYISGTPNSTQTIDFWGVQAEAGSVTTAFQTATGTLAGELAACQRYYEKSYSIGTAVGTVTTLGAYSGTRASGGWNTPTVFKVSKRSAPTVTVYSIATGTSARIRNRDAGTDEVATVSDIGENGSNATTGTGSTSGVLYGWQWEASAEL